MIANKSSGILTFCPNIQTHTAVEPSCHPPDKILKNEITEVPLQVKLEKTHNIFYLFFRISESGEPKRKEVGEKGSFYK